MTIFARPKSMGGLLKHTLVSDSGENLWNVFATKPLNSLSLSADVHAHKGRNTARAARLTSHRPELRRAEHEVKDSPMANLLRRIRVELPITTFHGWHLADGVVQQFRVLSRLV